MSNLTLSIKQQYFDEIKAGIKKIEARELKPKNNIKYLQHDENGCVLINFKGEITPRPYKTITFLTGAYKGTRPKMVVEVLSSEVVMYEDEKGELIMLQDENQVDYYAAVIEYKLGKILSV